MLLLRWVLIATFMGSILVIASLFPQRQPTLLQAFDEVQARAAARTIVQPTAKPSAAVELPTPTATSTETSGDEALLPPPTPIDTPDLTLPTGGPAIGDTATPTATLQSTAFVPSPVEVATSTPSQRASPTPEAPSGPTFVAPPDATLPALSIANDAVGVSSEARIDAKGGRVASADGRVVVDVPEGAFTAPLNVKITRHAPSDFTAPSPDRPFVGIWSFDATGIADGAAVHKFEKDLTFTLRFSADEFAGRDARNLMFWTLNESTNQWEPLRADADWKQLTMVGHADHFSLDAATASMTVDVAPLLDGRNTDLHSGSATLSYPLALPPGRGGLAPHLTLAYDSGALGEMRAYTSLGGEVGTGWNLDVPNVQIAQDSDFAPNDHHVHRVFLTIDGFSGEIMQDYATSQDSEGYIWRARDEQYIKIRTDRQDMNGAVWYVTTKDGTKYIFGGGTESSQYRRFTHDPVPGGGYMTRDYRADVVSITDLLGNVINFTYAQDRGDIGLGQYVVASYPSVISYNGGQVTVTFSNNGTRPDVPYNVTDPHCSGSYFAPPARELHGLTQIEVKQGATILRRYGFTYDHDTPFSWFCTPTTAPAPFAGEHKLTAVKLYDASLTAYPYTTSTFTYSTNGTHFSYYDSPSHIAWGYDWKFLTQANNPFGGIVSFQYSELGMVCCAGKHWSREAVTTETHNPGAGQPVMQTLYVYNGDNGSAVPAQWPYPNMYKWQQNHAYIDNFLAEYRGFSSVKVIDQMTGYSTEHFFFTAGSPDAVGWNYEVLSGREYDVITRDNAGAQWQRVTTNWQIRQVNNGIGFGSLTNFNFVSYVQTTLRDGTITVVRNTSYDAFGNLTGQQSEAPWGTVQTLSAYGYAQDTSANHWLFVPRYIEQYDPSNVLLSCARSYYDGAKDNNATPVRGLRTAQSTALNVTATRAQCESAGTGTPPFSNSTNTYTVYDTVGNISRSSNPTDLAPENQSASGGYGWVPAGVLYSQTDYDAPNRVYPQQMTNAKGQATQYKYGVAPNWNDYSIGKPSQVIQPTGRTINVAYDALFRPIKIWDNLDSSTYPTETFVYNWGPGALSGTLVQDRLTSGGQDNHNSVTCVDGFGRELARFAPYYSGSSTPLTSIVRTQYTSDGLKSVSAPGYYSSAHVSSCPGSLPAVSTLDRTVYANDPLGNVSRTSFSKADPPAFSPFTTADYRGTTTVLCDENVNTTRQERNLAARTLTIKEPASVPTGTCDPAGMTYNNTVYQYDRLGRLTDVTDALLNHTHIDYDLGGRKTLLRDPDMSGPNAAWTYTYDAAGNLRTQTDARGRITTINYDELRRPTSKTYSNEPAPGTPAVSYTYDAYPDTTLCPQGATAVGQMVKMTDGGGAGGAEYDCFDIRERNVTIRRIVDNTNYDVSRTYDNLSQLRSITYPDGGVVTYAADMRGTIDLKDNGAPVVANSQATPWLGVAQLVLGNGQTTTMAYDFRQRLTDVATTSAPQNTHITYDLASNITGINDIAGSDSATYGYDQLNRLKTMVVSGSTIASYTYDAIGNIQTKTEGATSLTLTYPASGPNSLRPHAPTLVTPAVGSPVSPTYDAVGDMLSYSLGGTNTYAYDAERRLTQQPLDAGGALLFSYDGHGTMVRSYNQATGVTTVYVGGGLYEKNMTTGAVTKYYSFLGRTVAMRNAGVLTYLLSDQIGSTSVMETPGGATATVKYWPYGSIRSSSGTVTTDRLFTGQQQDPGESALGLYNYKARFYGTTLGRFVSADPVADGLNRYAYAHDNPLRYVDPTGLDVAVDCGYKQSCENGDKIDDYRGFVQQYWEDEGYSFGPYSYDFAFNLMKWLMKEQHWNPFQTLDAFGVAFLDTSTSLGSPLANSSLSKYVDKLENLLRYDHYRASDRKIDTLIGYSEGGATVAKTLNDAHRNAPALLSYIHFVLLLDPAFEVQYLGDVFGVGALDQGDFYGIRIEAVNGYGTSVHGRVKHSAYNFDVSDCAGDTGTHCNHEQYAPLIVDTLLGHCLPMAPGRDYWILPVVCD